MTYASLPRRRTIRTGKSARTTLPGAGVKKPASPRYGDAHFMCRSSLPRLSGSFIWAALRSVRFSRSWRNAAGSRTALSAWCRHCFARRACACWQNSPVPKRCYIFRIMKSTPCWDWVWRVESAALSRSLLRHSSAAACWGSTMSRPFHNP